MDGTLRLKDIWKIENVRGYKVHFGRWNGRHQPLDLWVEDEAEWEGWQTYYPGRHDFNREYIFRLWISIMKAILGCLEESFVS